MFRAENVQRGRQRQFHQAGYEIYGDPGPACDAELVDMLVGLFRSLSIPGVRVRLNSLGGTETRARYREALLSYLRGRADTLSPHARERLEKNPLRVLDSKHPDDQAASAEAPRIVDVMTDDDKAHLQAVASALNALGTPFELDPRLVRGLDYYTRTVFEVTGSGGDLGSQDALAAGGRYDDLLQSLGCPKPQPGIGFAIGLERVLLAMPEVPSESEARVLLAPLSAAATERALVLAKHLRQEQISSEVDGRSGSLKAKLRRANSTGARLCILLGDDELARGVVTLKDLSLREQAEVPESELPARVKEYLARAVPAPSEESN
jgi:histidyl-tRNA synthetase